MKFREKPREIEARLFDGDTAALMDVVTWIKDSGYIWFELFSPAPSNGVTIDPSTGFLGIMTSQGLAYAEKGDYIYKDVAGEFKTAKAPFFESTFEEVDAGAEVIVPIVPPPVDPAPAVPPSV